MRPAFAELARFEIAAAYQDKRWLVFAAWLQILAALIAAPVAPHVAVFVYIPLGALIAQRAVAASRRADSLLARAVAADLIEVGPGNFSKAA